MTVYAITSLPAEQTRPAQLADWARGHWAIENSMHWMRDVTYAEDHSQVRTGSGPQVMAALRNFAISLIRMASASNIAAGLRHIARRPSRSLTMLRIT